MHKAYNFYITVGFKALGFCCLKQLPWRSGMNFSYDAPPFRTIHVVSLNIYIYMCVYVCYCLKMSLFVQ